MRPRSASARSELPRFREETRSSTGPRYVVALQERSNPPAACAEARCEKGPRAGRDESPLVSSRLRTLTPPGGWRGLGASLERPSLASPRYHLDPKGELDEHGGSGSYEMSSVWDRSSRRGRRRADGTVRSGDGGRAVRTLASRRAEGHHADVLGGDVSRSGGEPEALDLPSGEVRGRAGAGRHHADVLGGDVSRSGGEPEAGWRETMTGKRLTVSGRARAAVLMAVAIAVIAPGGGVGDARSRPTDLGRAQAPSRGAPSAAAFGQMLAGVANKYAQEHGRGERIHAVDCVRASSKRYMCSYAVMRTRARNECHLIQARWAPGAASSIVVTLSGRTARCGSLRAALDSLR